MYAHFGYNIIHVTNMKYNKKKYNNQIIHLLYLSNNL